MSEKINCLVDHGNNPCSCKVNYQTIACANCFKLERQLQECQEGSLITKKGMLEYQEKLEKQVQRLREAGIKLMAAKANQGDSIEAMTLMGEALSQTKGKEG